MHQKKTNTTNVEVKSFKFIPTCHHCGVVGHIRPHCYKLNKIASHDSFKPVCHCCGIVGHIRPNCFKLNRIPNSFSSFKPTCHHCGKIGHIKPNCVKLNKKAGVILKKHEKVIKPKIKSIWVRKSNLLACDVLKHDTLDDFEDSRVIDLAF